LFSGKVVIDSGETTISTPYELAGNVFYYRGSSLDLTVGELVFSDPDPMVVYAGAPSDNSVFFGGSPKLVSGAAEPGNYLIDVFFDMTPFAISTGKVLETLPALDTFPIRSFALTEYTPNWVGDALFQVVGIVDTLTSQSAPESIPEPGACLLLASSLVLGLTLRHRSRMIR
jgi:hypothetical protein